MVDIEPVAYADKLVLRELLNLYLYDASERDHSDPDAHGRFEYRYLDPYWIEPARHPFFIRRDGALAGFVLVSGHTEGGSDRGISEFFVLRRHRRSGVGSAAAAATFARFPGSWEIRVERSNAAANAFWAKVIGRLATTNLAVHDRIGAWDGPAWTFTIA